ncbi:MAG: DUF454 family protein [Methylococcales bacterium]|nr:DUF454 family protein [Methylococcales bacterium]
MLLINRWFGSSLKQWEESHTISSSSKAKAMILITVTFAISIAILQGRLYLQLGLVTLGVILLFFIWRLKKQTLPNQLSIKINKTLQ